MNSNNNLIKLFHHFLYGFFAVVSFKIFEKKLTLILECFLTPQKVLFLRNLGYFRRRKFFKMLFQDGLIDWNEKIFQEGLFSIKFFNDGKEVLNRLDKTFLMNFGDNL